MPASFADWAATAVCISSLPFSAFRWATWSGAARTGWTGTTGWVSVLSLTDGSMANRMVEVEHGTDVADVRLVPLASGKVALVTGEDVTFFSI